MILPAAVARGVVEGRVTRVYRRWSRARVRAGSTLRTAAGVVRIEGVEETDPATITDADAAAAGEASTGAVRAGLRGGPADPVFLVRLAPGGPDPRAALSADDDLSGAEVERITAALARLDRASRHGPWTRTVLQAVAANPGRRAADLAAGLGRDRDPFKLDVRKLKNLGLTNSLEVGYRISPRGAAYLRATAGRG